MKKALKQNEKQNIQNNSNLNKLHPGVHKEVVIGEIPKLQTPNQDKVVNQSWFRRAKDYIDENAWKYFLGTFISALAYTQFAVPIHTGINKGVEFVRRNIKGHKAFQTESREAFSKLMVKYPRQLQYMFVIWPTYQELLNNNISIDDAISLLDERLKYPWYFKEAYENAHANLEQQFHEPDELINFIQDQKNNKFLKLWKAAVIETHRGDQTIEGKRRMQLYQNEYKNMQVSSAIREIISPESLERFKSNVKDGETKYQSLMNLFDIYYYKKKKE